VHGTTQADGQGDGQTGQLSDTDEIRAEEYRYWHSRPIHERMAAVSELSSAMYGPKHDESEVPRLDKTFARFERVPKPGR
jgi:hypothetical protein